MVKRTLALIKPDAVGKQWTDIVLAKNEDAEEEGAPAWNEVLEAREADPEKRLTMDQEIEKRILAAGFRVADRKQVQLTKAQAMEFYVEHAEKPFYGVLTDFMSSGPCIALVLEKDEDTIAAWRAMMGPTNSEEAKAKAEAEHPLNEEHWSLRALFGSDGTRNATHGSDSDFSALREISFFFPAHKQHEQTVVVVKPHAEEHVDAIVGDLEARGLVVTARVSRTLSKEDAKTLYAAHASHAFFDNLVSNNTSGASTALLVEGDGAIDRVRLLAGPSDAGVAAAKLPSSLRARYGDKDDINNGVRVSGSQEEVERDLAFWWPAPLPVERTLALIKPGTARAAVREIKAEILRRGFTVLAEKSVQLSSDDAAAFYAEHEGKAFFPGLIRYMSSAPTVAMALARPGAVHMWRAMMGPTNPEVARQEAPNSMRARYGSANPRNATHGSDSDASSRREINFFFPSIRPEPVAAPAEAEAYIKDSSVATVMTPMGAVPKTLHNVLVEGLTALCKAKPAGLEAVAWLGQWLVDNNPRNGRLGAGAGAGGVGDGAESKVPESAFTGSDAAALPEADVVETTVGGEDSASAPLTAADRPAAIVFVLGGPGSGKGTQCARIAEGFGYTHLSTGDLLRAEVAAGTPTGKEAEALMKEGNLVPTRIVLALLKKAVVKQRGGKFLIDGYPRTLDQAFEFERMIGAPTFVLAYGADDDVLTQRLLERGKTSGRADDNEDTIRQRLRTFHQESAPVIDFYGKLGLVRSVPSVGSPDEVFAATAPHFHPEVIFVLGGPGSGKGTQCARIADAYGYTHLSTGDLLRAEVASGSKRGQSIADIMRVGDLVPVEVTMEVLGDAIRANPSGRFLVDGFPRTVEQAQLFEASVGPVHRVLVLDVEAAECRRRALSRASVEHRADDTHAGISGQLRVWKNATQGVVSLYESLGLVHHVDGSGTPDQVWGRVQRLFSRHVTFVLGGPGSGKGTQCARLVSEFGFVHLSAGDLLRAEVARGSPDGAMIQSYIAEGKIVPVAVTLALLRAAMDAASMGSANGRNTRFLVDGFPRAADQAAAYEASLGAPDGVLFFDLSEAAMRERLLERGKTSGRADDNEDTIVKRFETFRDTSLPVIHSYARRGLVTRVDASGDIDAVYASTRSGFASRVVFVVGDEGRAGAVVQHLVDTQGAVHLDVGAMVAAEAKRGTPVGAAIRERGADAGARLAVLRQGQQGVGDGLAVVTGFGPEEGDVEAYTSSAGVSEPEAVLFLSATGGAVPAYASALAGSRGATVVRTDGTDESSMLKAASAPFQPELVVLVGASGSGRGEFSMRASLQMGYATLRMTHILRDAAAAGGADGHAIGEALALKRTTPLGPTLRALRKAMLAFPRTRRFILDGFPRQVSAGFPSVHDQVFALEESFGPLRGAISLDARLAVRRARCIPGNPTVGEEAALVASVDAYEREKLPVLRFFESYRMARSVDTGAGADSTPDAVFESARGILDGGARDPLGFQPPLPPPEEKPAEVGEEDPDDF